MSGVSITVAYDVRQDFHYQTLLVERKTRYITATINRPDSNNAINTVLLADINNLMDIAEQDPAVGALILCGRDGVFYAGMDFSEYVTLADDQVSALSSLYMNTLKRFSLSPLVIICNPDGRVLAGGVGLVAAADLVVTSPRTQFSLSEILWGLLPACVLTFLIRRIGFQSAYAMTFTSQTVDAAKAQELKLIDILTDTADEEIRKLLIKLLRLDRQSIANAISYFRKICLINDDVEAEAIRESTRLAVDPKVRSNIRNYIHNNDYPWNQN